MASNNGSDEKRIIKLLDPHGHDVVFIHGSGYYCSICDETYEYEELQKIPMDNRSDYHPKVYGSLV